MVTGLKFSLSSAAINKPEAVCCSDNFILTLHAKSHRFSVVKLIYNSLFMKKDNFCYIILPYIMLVSVINCHHFLNKALLKCLIF